MTTTDPWGSPPPTEAPEDDPGYAAYERNRQPHDIDAEQAVLGALMLARAAYDDVHAVGLKSGHFYRPQHEAIAEALYAMHEAGEVVDGITAAAELQKRGTLARVGGHAYLHTLLASTPTAANAGHYARIVADNASLRAVIRTGLKLQQLGQATEGGDAAAIVDAAEAEVAAMVAGATRTPTGVLMADILDDVIEGVESGQAVIPTPWFDLNRFVGGFVNGGHHILGAYTGGGKTISGAQIAVHSARVLGLRVAVCTTEMTARQYTLNAFAQLGPCDVGHLVRGGAAMDDADWNGLARARRLIETGGPGGGPIPLYVDDSSGMTPADIRAAARECTRRLGGCDMIVVDFLQNLRLGIRVDSRRVEVDALAYSLKGIAKDFHIPVVTLAQLNRAATAAGNRFPILADFREAGGIEQSGDWCVLWHRDAENAPTIVYGCVRKNRQGPTSSDPDPDADPLDDGPGREGDHPRLVWDARHARFLNRAGEGIAESRLPLVAGADR